MIDEGYEDAIVRFNRDIAPLLYCPPIERMTEKRARHLRARLKDCPDLWNLLEAEARRTDPKYLGQGDGAIKFLSFDWLTKSPDNLQKFLEGMYRGKEAMRRAIQEAKPTDEELEAEYLRDLAQRRILEESPRPVSPSDGYSVHEPERCEGGF